MKIIERLLALLILIAISPIFIIISILIKLESKGDIFFKQERIGENGKPFYIYKFRSMKVGTPHVATNSLQNPEQFITKIGKILRISSLDELPQLINIIKGEMSFVGFRPVLKKEKELNELRKEMDIFSIKPGITGWAQINGRDDLDNFTKATLDRYYVDNKSLFLYIKILFLTVYKVIKKDGIREISINEEEKKMLD